MNGIQYIHKKQSGKGLTSILILLSVLAALAGCSAGRGDWKYEFTNGYVIDRVNGHSIVIAYQDAPASTAKQIVIPCFFVTDFCSNDQYIGLKGIHTQGLSASDEELKNGKQVYYLIDILSKEVFGPFEEETTYLEQCETLNVGEMGEWFSTSDPGSFL